MTKQASRENLTIAFYNMIADKDLIAFNLNMAIILLLVAKVRSISIPDSRLLSNF